jgi:predicted dehydrogenase
MNSSDLSRRQFAKSAAGIAAAFGLSNFDIPDFIPTAHAAGTPVNWAMVGTGTRGHELLRQISTMPHGRCTALCDIYPPNLKKAVENVATNPFTTDDYRRVLERKDVDAVLIATPLNLHARQVLDTLDAGKHVFIEKTMVFKEPEIQAVRDAVAAHPKQVFQVGLQRRYSLVYRMAIEMIRKGALGKVTHVRAHWHRNSDWRRPVADPKLERQINWRMYREYSGGLAAELCSHQIDVANWAFNAEPRSVIGFGGIDYWKDGRETYDNISLLFEYAEGQKVIYSSMLNNQHYEFGEQIMGDGGTLETTLMGPSGSGTFWIEPKAKVAKKGQVAAKEQWWAGATVAESAKQQGFPVFPDTVGEGASFLQREKAFAQRWLAQRGWFEVHEPVNPVGAQLDHFLQCIRDGLKPVADINVGAGDAEAVYCANLAMDEERRVYFPKYRNGKNGKNLKPVS